MVSCWRRVLARRRFKAAVHSVFVAKHLWRLGHSPRHPAVHLVHQLNQYCATPGCTHFRLMHIPMLCLQRGTDNAIPLGGSTSLGTRLFQLQHNAFEHLDTIGSLAAGGPKSQQLPHPYSCFSMRRARGLRSSRWRHGSS